MAASGIEKTLRAIRTLPRVSLANIRSLPESTRKKYIRRRGQHGGKTHGHYHKGQWQHGTRPQIGFEGGQTPFHVRIPCEPYYRHHEARREFLPVSLLQLQRLIDLGKLDPAQPIDLTNLCNSKIFKMEPNERQYGVTLTDDGVDCFKAKVNIEVQWASEQTIAAVERNGGVITTRFYDMMSLNAKVNPFLYFSRGLPIPRCKLPPQDYFQYYSSAENRGYLAADEAVQEARIRTAQKYGYNLPDVDEDADAAMLKSKKNRFQLFDGLEAGWVVNLKDRVIMKPTQPEIVDFYKSD